MAMLTPVPFRTLITSQTSDFVQLSEFWRIQRQRSLCGSTRSQILVGPRAIVSHKRSGGISTSDERKRGLTLSGLGEGARSRLGPVGGTIGLYRGTALGTGRLEPKPGEPGSCGAASGVEYRGLSTIGSGKPLPGSGSEEGVCPIPPGVLLVASQRIAALSINSVARRSLAPATCTAASRR